MARLDLNEWWCLKEGRSHFSPKLPDDAGLVFCHEKILQADILSSVQMQFATDRPIKMLITGDWGVGKTHVLRHLMKWLEDHADDFPATTVYIELGDLTPKSHFDEIVRPLLDNLTIDYLIKLLHDFRAFEGGRDVQQELKAAGVTPNVAEVLNMFLMTAPGSTPPQQVQQAFDFLRGRAISGHPVGPLAQQLQQGHEMVAVLRAIGFMHRKVRGHRIVFIVDEASRLEKFEANSHVEDNWVNANRLIFDAENDEFGFIYALHGQSNDLPGAIWEAQIQNRLGPSNKFELSTLTENQVSDFLSALLDEMIDWGKVDEKVESGVISKAEFSRDWYPFDEEGRGEFEDFFNNSSANAKPRDMSENLSEVAFFAAKDGLHLIPKSVVETAEYQWGAGG